MSLEIPYNEIRDLQISLYKQAGLSLYNPDDKGSSFSLSNLPSLSDSISQIDPSPDYLRCKHCKARLLRGVISLVCVFCGRLPNKDVPPQPIKFFGSFGCKWLLHSLDLDGSEVVEPSVGANESNRGQNTQQSQIPLSDLLDLEIRWPAESENIENGVSEKTLDQSLSSLKFSGVDFDNFFIEGKLESVSGSSDLQSAINKQNDAMQNKAFEDHANLSLFENVHPSNSVGMSKEDESSDPFSGWDAEFQSASSGIQHPDSKFSDPFAGSSSVDLLAHMDSVFGPGKDLFDGKTKESTASVPNTDNWFKDDPWSNPSTRVVGQAEQFNVPVNGNSGGKVRNADDSSSGNIDWFQDNQWQTTSTSKASDNKNFDENDDSFDAWDDFTSSTSVQVPSQDSTHKAADNKNFDENNDSFDAWDDFTSSTSVQVPSQGSLKQDVNPTMPLVDQASEINFFGEINSQDIGSFSQSDFFSGTFNNQNGPLEVNSLQPETSISDRVAIVNGRDGIGTEEIGKGNDVLNTRPKVDDAESLMSQMHDLSFMLESSLSIPQKIDTRKIDPFSSFSKD